MNSKKLVRIFLMLVFFVMIHTVSVNAASVEDVTFDSDYYASTNSDVVAVLGNNATALKSHFMNWGIKEGRQGSIYFDVKDYLAKNKDIATVFGAQNYEGAYNHFAQFGLNEGRVASKVFDVNYYLANNSDVAKVFGTNKVEVYAHFINFGVAEGRAPSASFDPKHYLVNNADVAKVFGNYQGAAKHYAIWGYKEGRKSAAADHVYGPETVKEATCTEKGSKAKACKACGYVEIEEIEVAGHKIAEGKEPEVVQELSCTQNGIVKYTCEVCEQEVEDVTEATGHKLVYESEKSPSTCEAKGEDYYVCSVCDYTEVQETAALGHDYKKDTSAGAINKEPTCSVEGFSTVKCTRCGNVKAETKPATGVHEYDDTKTVVVSKVATCTESGEVTFTCKTCDKEITKAIPAAHVWTKTRDLVTPSCTENGKEEYKCERCEQTKTETVQAEGHDMVESTNPSDGYKAATCTTVGDAVKVCANGCGHKEVLVGAIPVLNHDWHVKADSIPADKKCGDVAEVTYECTNSGCDEEKTENKVLTHDDFGYNSTTSTYEDGDTKTTYACKAAGCDYSYEERTHTGTMKVVSRKHHAADKDGNTVTVTERCSNCDQKVVKGTTANAWSDAEDAVNDHVRDTGTITTEPNCNNTGVKTYKCTICDTPCGTETIAKDYTKHVLLKNTADAGKVATCKEEGEENYVCKVCSPATTIATLKTPVNTAIDTTKAHDADENKNHNWGAAAKEVVEPTCAKKGYSVWECADCHATINDTETAEDLTNGHNWVAGAYPVEVEKDDPDYGKYFIKIYCDVCKRTHNTDIISATALTTEAEIKSFVDSFNFDTYKTTQDYTDYVASLKAE